MPDYQANVMTNQKCGTNCSANCAAQTDVGDISSLCVGEAALKGTGDGDFYSVFHDDAVGLPDLNAIAVDEVGAMDFDKVWRQTGLNFFEAVAIDQTAV